MRYAINFDKVVNQLIPYYLGGRRLILFLQSCMKPLQQIQETFITYAKETRIEAAMTSQIFKLEWFLNRKFNKYFEDPSGLITINNGRKFGLPVYNESASEIPDEKHLKLWKENGEYEHINPTFYYNSELPDESSYSFLVCVPKLFKFKGIDGKEIDKLVDGITEDQFKAQLTNWINKYRLSGKSFEIIINTQ